MAQAVKQGPGEILCGDLGKRVPGKGGGGPEGRRNMWVQRSYCLTNGMVIFQYFNKQYGDTYVNQLNQAWTEKKSSIDGHFPKAYHR